jgi:FMN phosphatase YigB (HAD superfamily)
MSSAMLEAVLFDWGDTLMQWTWQDELLEAGHRAGLAALGRDEVPDAAAVAARFRERYLPLLRRPGVLEEVEYPGLLRELLGEVGVAATDDELARYLEAEHAAWQPARQLGAQTWALLESLRDRGLKLGLV